MAVGVCGGRARNGTCASRGSPRAQDFYRACGFDADEIERIQLR